MRYALVDHSTLSACQRLLGAIEVANLHALDGDICALESLVRSILFYDGVFFLDDYKLEFRERRKEYFPNLIAIPADTQLYTAAVAKAKKFTADITLRIESGEITDSDFKNFFRLLDMHCLFEWNMRSSEFFLVMKMLGSSNGIDVAKFSKLQEMIFSELKSKSASTFKDPQRNPVLKGSDGSLYPFVASAKEGRDHISRQVKAFVASLNWLSLRTAVYMLVAGNYQIDPILHPIRNSFQLTYATKSGAVDESKFVGLIQNIALAMGDTALEIKSATDPLAAPLDWPLFSAWIVSRTKDPARLLEAAYELRLSKDFVDARRQLVELEDIAATREHKDFVKAANKLIGSINKHSKLLKQKYGIDCGQGVATGPVIAVLNAVLAVKGLVQLPGVDVKLPMPNVVIRYLGKPGFKALFSNIVDDLSSVSKLGALHNILTSRVRRAEDAYEIDAKETPEHLKSFETHWKRPM